MKNQEQYFTTFDLNLTVVLVANKFPLERVEKEEGSKSRFYFASSKKLTSFLEKYWKGKIKMNPQDIFSSLKAVKNRLYSDYQ